MKNCRGKLRKRIFSDSEFNERLGRAIRAPRKLVRNVGKTTSLGKSDVANDNKDEFFSDYRWREKSEDVNLLTAGDISYAEKVLFEFMDAEQDFIKYLRDDKNWELEGEDAFGLPVYAEYIGMKCCE
jgi:hypothetical protein